VTLAVDAPHAATAQVAPEPQEVERASKEVRSNPIHQNVRLNINVHNRIHRSRQIKLPRNQPTLPQRIPVKLKYPLLRPCPNRSQEPRQTLLMSMSRYQ
jgi:hypothetical protein